MLTFVASFEPHFLPQSVSDSNSDPEGARSYEKVRAAVIAGLVCVLLGISEHLEQVFYARQLQWARGQTYATICDGCPGCPLDIEGNWKPLPRPVKPRMLDFLPALRAAAKVAFPIIGVKIESTDK